MKPYRDGPHHPASSLASCNCRFCYLALNPPKTWTEYESFGLHKIRAESAIRIYGSLTMSEWSRRPERPGRLDEEEN